MCIFGGGGQKAQQLARPLPKPEAVADPAEVAAARRQEDLALFGGVPDLRVDRSVAAGGAVAGGTGIKMN